MLQARLTGLGPFEDVTLSFADERGDPRQMTVVHGGGGVGKTTLLQALAMTRPGYAVALPSVPVSDAAPPRACCAFRLGQDDPDRPHALWVSTPGSRVFDDDEREAMRRREQVVFDRVAREGGFASVCLPATRWFSRQALVLSAPGRTMARYDVRASSGFDEVSSSDLARETKQALSYAKILGYVAPSVGQSDARRLGALSRAMTDAVNELVHLAGFELADLDPVSLEPRFHGDDGSMVTFDQLPTGARHLVAFAALPVRTLWAAYPARDPREAEGLVLIDEVDLHQDVAVQASLPGALGRALPAVQWIVTTGSQVVASGSEANDVVALRRSDTGKVELFTDVDARTH